MRKWTSNLGPDLSPVSQALFQFAQSHGHARLPSAPQDRQALAPSHLNRHVSGFDIAVSADSILLTFSVTFAIGAFFGFHPARRAAALDPIEPLQYE